MKKYLTFAAAALVFASCSVTAPDVDDYRTPDDGVTTPEPIVFGSNVRTSTTKAQGPLDEFTAAQDLYILGYVRTADLSYRTPFINNVMAKSPAGNGAIEVLDASNKNNPFYYNATNAYDFYGYYVDDAVTMPSRSLVREDAQVYIDVNIKGTQDILLGKADPEADIAAAKVKYADDPEKLARINQVAAQDAYSGYAARRYVHPTLKFTHQLVRFNYQVVPMTEEAQKIKITSVQMTECFTQGRLVIAGRDVTTGITNARTAGTLTLCTKNGTTVTPITATAPVSLASATIGAPFRVGAGLLVMAQDQYGLSMTFDQDGVSTGHTEKFTLSPDMIPGVVAFETGKQYTVTIKLYGFQKVEISVELTPWQDGGEIEIDEDNKPQN